MYRNQKLETTAQPKLKANTQAKAGRQRQRQRQI